MPTSAWSSRPASREDVINRLIALDALQQAYRALSQGAEKVMHLLACAWFISVTLFVWFGPMVISPTFKLPDDSLASLSQLEYFALSTLPPLAISLLFPFFSLILSLALTAAWRLFDPVAVKIWGRAYLRRLPEWTRSESLQSLKHWLSGLDETEDTTSTLCRWVRPEKVFDAITLCTTCNNLDFDENSLQSPTRRMKYYDVQQTATDCVTCSIIVGAIRRFIPRARDISNPLRKEWYHYQPTDELRVTWWGVSSTLTIDRVDYEYDTELELLGMDYSRKEDLKSFYKWMEIDKKYRRLELRFYCVGEKLDSPLISSPIASRADPQSEAGLNQVTSWMDTCMNSHEHCERKKPKPLPDRVLDVGESSDCSIRLSESTNQLDYYACLSHQWGSVQPLRTLAKNKTSFMAGIPMNSLPKTFRDAVVVCRKLSIRYLWIDSLCIIQDSTEDWQRQSTKMATIYENAALTIAATNASGHHEGLFLSDEQDIPAYVERVPSWAIGHGVSMDVYASLVETDLGCGTKHWDFRSHYTTPEEWPLLARAWVFQERVLSPRILHFLERGMIWDCRTGVSCDCLVTKPDDTDELKFRRLINGKSMTMIDATPKQLRSLWYVIVMRYSEVMGNLTYESDVLPALSGLASRIAELLDDQYIAGLWRSNLIEGLLWISEDRNSCMRLKSWRAPSWSWASMVDRVAWVTNPDTKSSGKRTSPNMLQLDEVYAQVVTVSTTLTGREPTGSITAASLSLSGWVSDATISNQVLELSQRQGRKSDLSTNPNLKRTSNRIRLTFNHSGDKGSFYPDSLSEIHDGEAVLCLKLARIESCNWYLVLVEQTPGLAEFKRLGLYKKSNLEWKWGSSKTWHRRAEERFHEYNRTLFIV